MRKYIPILFLFLTPAFLHPILAQNNEEFNSVEKELINREVLTIVNSYRKYGGLTETFTYLSKIYTDEFRSLFAPEANLLNDIGSPENQEEYININEYMTVIQDWYPEGLAIEFEDFIDDIKNKDIGSPYVYKDKFAVRTNLDKKVSALTKEYDKVGKVFPITMIIAFDRGLTKFEIVEINTKQSLNPEDVLAQVTKKENKSVAEKASKKENKSVVEKVRRKPTRKKSVKLKLRKPRLYKPENRAEKGLFVGLLGASYLSSTQFRLNNTLTTTFNMNDVSTKSPISPYFRVEADYFLTENFGVGVGLGYSTYKSNLSIDSLSMNRFNVKQEGKNEIANRITFKGDGIEEYHRFTSISISPMLKYKQPISDNFFLYGGIGPKFVFIGNQKITRRANSLIHESAYNDNGDWVLDVVMEGFIPKNEEEAAALEEYNLFKEAALEEYNLLNEAISLSVEKVGNELSFKRMPIVGMMNLGFAYSLDKRLKIKLGGVATFGGNALEGEKLSNPESILGLIEVLPDSGPSVRSVYLSATNRKGNQLNIRAVGLEIGLMYKIGNIDRLR